MHTQETTLLADGRVDPNALDGYPMRIAMKQEHVAIVKLLLRDPILKWYNGTAGGSLQS
jgi:hypothetical protein